MTLHVPEDILAAHNLSEREFAVEVACRLFDAGVLTFHEARRLAVLDRPALEAALLARRLTLHRPTADEFNQDLRDLDAARRQPGPRS